MTSETVERRLCSSVGLLLDRGFIETWVGLPECLLSNRFDSGR